MTIDGMPKITPAAVKDMAEAIPKIIDKHPVASSIAAAVIPVPGAEEAVEARVGEDALQTGEKTIEQLEKEGHAPQRHGGPNRVTDQQLYNRITKNIDPASGTKFDAFKKDRFGRPKLHQVGKHATAFTSDDALILAESAARKSPQFEEYSLDAKVNHDPIFVIKSNLEDIFGR